MIGFDELVRELSYMFVVKENGMEWINVYRKGKSVVVEYRRFDVVHKVTFKSKELESGE